MARGEHGERAALSPAPAPVVQTAKTLPESPPTEPLTAGAARPTFRAATVSAKVAEVVGTRESNAQLLKLLTRDTPVRITEERGAWAKVEVPTGLYVWVYGKYLTENAEPIVHQHGSRASPIPALGPPTIPRCSEFFPKAPVWCLSAGKATGNGSKHSIRSPAGCDSIS